MATTVRSTNRLLTTERDARLARGVLADLQGPEGFLSAGPASNQQALPHELGVLIQQILESLAEGGTVTVTSVPSELTTSAAAAMLGVSRPTLMKMIAGNELPSHKVGTHTRLTARDVLAFLTDRHERQREAFSELRDLLDE